ncbi:2739_t:CDS:1, partial [Gigaspora rosea]
GIFLWYNHMQAKILYQFFHKITNIRNNKPPTRSNLLTEEFRQLWKVDLFTLIWNYGKSVFV